MNRRGFLGRCLAGALLGLARNLPLPATPTFRGIPIRLTDEPMTATEITRRWEERMPVHQDLLRDMQRALDSINKGYERAVFYMHADVHAKLVEIKEQALAEAEAKRKLRRARRMP